MALPTSSIIFFSIILHLACCGKDTALDRLTFSSRKSLKSLPTAEVNSSTVHEVLEATAEEVCPVGFYSAGGSCECLHNPLHILICNGSYSASIQTCYCATQDESTGLLQVGACSYNCGHRAEGLHHSDLYLYSLLPRNATQLDTICSSLNRAGALCGRCLQNHFSLAYSFNWTCVQCSNYKWNWLRYIAAAYLPLTLFCLAIVVFQANLASSHLYALVTYMQVIAMPVTCRIMLEYFSEDRVSLVSATAVKVLLSLYGVWNLDFFRPFYSDICLGIGVLPTLALDYLIAIFPLLFMAFVYIAITLYDKNYRVVVVLWSPVHLLLSRIRRNWNIRTSVVDAFSTFFLLSNIKFLSVSFDLLIWTNIYNLQGQEYNHSRVLYYAADLEFMGKDHLPYAVLAIGVLVVFVVVPVTVLILYPFRLFQKLLNVFPAPWHVLHTFMDSFQGCYKDGTEPGTRDCRWFHSVYFLCRFFLFFLYGATLNVEFFFFAAFPLMLATLIIAVVRPFKSFLPHLNLIHAFFFQLLGLLSVTLAGLNVSLTYTHHYGAFLVLTLFLLLVPLMYPALLLFHLLFKRRRAIIKAVRYRKRRQGYAEISDEGEVEVLDRFGKP